MASRIVSQIDIPLYLRLLKYFYYKPVEKNYREWGVAAITIQNLICGGAPVNYRECTTPISVSVTKDIYARSTIGFRFNTCLNCLNIQEFPNLQPIPYSFNCLECNDTGISPTGTIANHIYASTYNDKFYRWFNPASAIWDWLPAIERINVDLYLRTHNLKFLVDK